MSDQYVPAAEALGSELARLRRDRGLSLDEAAQTLRCTRSVLQALENDAPTGLAPVYVRGHLTRYADLLELDEDTRAALLASIDDETPDVRTVFETPAPVLASDRWMRAASYLLASLLVGTLAWQLAHEAVRLARVDQEAVAGAAAAAGEPAAAHVNASIGGLESLHPSVSGSLTGNAGARAWAALDETRRQQDLRSALAEGEHLLEIETSADTWVEIHGADDALLEQDLLRGGERRSYRGEGPYRISLGRASAVRLTLDGQPVPLEAFTREDVARVLLDPDTFLADAERRNGS